jgi:hypothetical protein
LVIIYIDGIWNRPNCLCLTQYHSYLSVTQKASVFVKANKNLLGNYKDSSLVNYGIYYGHKKIQAPGQIG